LGDLTLRKPRKQAPKQKVRLKKRKVAASSDSFLQASDLLAMKDNLQKYGELSQRTDDRLQDIEIHLNLLTRLLTTLCVEKFGMRIGVLKRMIKRIEKEAIRDSQILHLEELYKLSSPSADDTPANLDSPHPSDDPWEDIS
jgi:hypothetical protein